MLWKNAFFQCENSGLKRVGKNNPKKLLPNFVYSTLSCIINTMDSRYNHLEHEALMYQAWEKAAAFNPDTPQPGRKKTDQNFCIIMPPPNANDPLHIGHAMFITLEDMLIRYHRMLGDDALWLPGVDHAGIETQFVFEKKLKKEGQSRFNFDRQTLYQMIWDYVQANSGIAVDQMKKIGASADWSRFTFTLDQKIVNSVLMTFDKLHEAGLIYRDLRLVNYCTNCGTSYSELEVSHLERTDPLFYIRYPLVSDPTQFVVVTTVRPEPIFVDTHLAINPLDPKNKHLIGQKVLNPLTKVAMEIIADEFVDPEFGTGIVKLTPAHDPTDFEVAQKRKLPIVSAIDFNGKMLPNAGKYAGLKVDAARQAVVADLEAENLIEKTDEKYSHRVGTCYRCGRVLEPLLRPQFFVKVQPLVTKALRALDQGDVTILGAGYDKILRHWLTNLKDWNISRQIVWGIRIPVWYPIKGNEGQITVGFLDQTGKFQQGLLSEWLKPGENQISLEEIKAGLQQVLVSEKVTNYVVSETTPGEAWIRDTDTFDTWFSSGQWPFVTLQNTQPNDFERFYPTTVMETSYDILPFWVMRMMLLGYFMTDKPPFKTVYLHGLVRDAQGRKMSKSKGNVVNPLEVIEKYGADALRLALTIRSTAGLDKSVNDGDFKAMRNFTNKLWNAARFVVGLEKTTTLPTSAPGDAAFTEKMLQLVTTITRQLNDLKLGLATDTAYNEFWHWYCDECIEAAKKGDISREKLFEGLVTFLQLLHPIVPFVTEAIWQAVKTDSPTPLPDLLINHPWPAAPNHPQTHQA